jgi:chromosome segregation ATPase
MMPLDEACRQIFDEAVKRSVRLTKQHYQWRYNTDMEKFRAESDAKLKAEKTRLEAHVSSLGARAMKAERTLEDANAAYNDENRKRKALERTVANQQAIIDRLNYTLVNLGQNRSRSRSPQRSGRWS